MTACYAEAAEAIAARLGRGLDVALLCEGDPFFYGSSMYLFDRLRDRFPMEIVPGVLGMSGCWAEARLPMTHGDDVLAVVPGTMTEAGLHRSLSGVDAAVIMKLGRNLTKVRAVLTALGRLTAPSMWSAGRWRGRVCCLWPRSPMGPRPISR